MGMGVGAHSKDTGGGGWPATGGVVIDDNHPGYLNPPFPSHPGTKKRREAPDPDLDCSTPFRLGRRCIKGAPEGSEDE